MKKRIMSVALVLVLIVIICTPIAGAAGVSDLRASIERQYSVRLDISRISAWDSQRQLSEVRLIGELLAIIPPELHSAMVSHFRSAGRTITIRLSLWNGGNIAGTYSHESATITLMTTDGLSFIPLMDPYIFAHEYGHMLHSVINGRYGSAKFSSEWTALNKGIAYGTQTYESIDNTVFISQYASTRLGEDVAETYGFFAGEQRAMRFSHNELKGTNVWEKAMLLERVAKSTLGIDRIFFPTYVPQTPSSWATEAVGRGFGTSGATGVFHRVTDGLLYQEAISRAEFCEVLIGMTNSVGIARHGRSVFFNTRYVLFERRELVDITNPITGARTADVEMVNSFADSYHSAVTYATYLGVVSGVSATEFNPNGKLTREQAAVILERLCRTLGVADKGGSAPAPVDAGSISDWALCLVFSWAGRLFWHQK